MEAGLVFFNLACLNHLKFSSLRFSVKMECIWLLRSEHSCWYDDWCLMLVVNNLNRVSSLGMWALLRKIGLACLRLQNVLCWFGHTFGYLCHCCKHIIQSGIESLQLQSATMREVLPPHCVFHFWWISHIIAGERHVLIGNSREPLTTRKKFAACMFTWHAFCHLWHG